jgi:beta-lactamase regulating signal transducer with metallopeptidase domain
MMLLVEFFSEPFWYRLGLTFAHFLWQGAIAAILAGAVVGLFRVRRGNARYAAYLLAFAAMTACPIATFIILDAPASGGSLIPIVVRGEGVSPLSPEAVPTSNKGQMPSSRGAGTTAGAINRSAPVDSVGAHRTISDYIYMSIPSALAAWSTGVLVLSIRLILGLMGAWRWRRNLEPLPAALAGRVGLLCERLGIPDFSRVFVSPSAIQAMAVGYLRPMILLPAALVVQMQPEMLEAVIAHELAHIRRFDLWVNLLQRVVETLLFFHPAVWWLSHRIQQERELCCDELAVKATGEPIVYAAALESATLAAFALRPPALAAGFGRDKKPTLSRVRHVLGLAPSRPGVRFWLAGIVTITFLLALAVPFVLIRRDKTERSIADLFEVKFDRAKWAAVTTSTRPARGRPEQAQDRLQLYTKVKILDPDRVLGISMRGAITQFEAGGRTIDVNDRTSVGPYMAPRYGRRFVRPPKPSRWTMAVRSFLRLPPLKRPRPRPVFELDESRVRLEIDSGLPGPDVAKIGRIKGYFWVAAAGSLEYVDVPFKSSEKWVRLTDDLEVRVSEAKSYNFRYQYKIETRTAAGAFRMGPLRPGSTLPDRLAANQLLIGADGKTVHHRRLGFLRSFVGGSGSGSGSNLDIIEKIRFVIAVNPTHCKVPFELENIPLRGHEATHDEAPRVRLVRGGRTANPSRFSHSIDDGAILRNEWTNLSWEPAADATSYNVYLGDCFEDVNNGAADTFRGNQKGTHLIVGFRGFAYPEGLVPGTTYYWRVDPVCEADPNNPRKGDIRSFSVPPRIAHDPVPADGAESVDSNAELSWTPGLDAKLHWVYFGEDLETVTGASGGRPQPKSTFTPPALVPGTTYYWRVDEFDPPNTHTGEIWSFTVKGGAE